MLFLEVSPSVQGAEWVLFVSAVARAGRAKPGEGCGNSRVPHGHAMAGMAAKWPLSFGEARA